MRLVELEISGFRGFSQHEHFDLDASAIIVVGANGQGKTSFFDAILWAMTGTIPRLGSDDANLLSMYSETGEARVSLILNDQGDKSLRIVRRFDGEKQSVRAETSQSSAQGAKAEALIDEVLSNSPESVESPMHSRTDVLTRSIYLQQDLVREFIESDDEQRRFSVASELCGAGRITDLQQQLERSRNAWNRATNTQVSDAEILETKVAEARERLSRLQKPQELDDSLTQQWNEWWSSFFSVINSPISPPSPGAAEGASVLNSAVHELRLTRQKIEQGLDRAESLKRDFELNDFSHESPDLPKLQEQSEVFKKELETLRNGLASARTRAAEERRRQVETAEKQQDLATLAEIALRNLGDSECPVCGQTIDDEKVGEHLHSRLLERDSTEATDDRIAVDIEQLSRQYEQIEGQLAENQAAIQRAESLQREKDLWIADRDRRLEELDLDPSLSDTETRLSELIAQLSKSRADLQKLEDEAERISLRVARISEASRREDIERSLSDLERELVNQNEHISDRQQTAELASKIINELREVSLDVVANQMEEIGPLLQRIYSTADPHPAFRSVRVLSRVFRGKGRLATEITDPLRQKASNAPEFLFSSSQMNALAVSIFLALNLGVQSPPLSTIMLDDPLQSLDDVNLLGLIDLFRRLVVSRQFVVSTHDARFGRLLQRKLRPVFENQRTRVIEFESWERSGPVVKSYDVVHDSGDLRIVAA